MKKIPTLFERVYDDTGKMIGITDHVKPGLEFVLEGKCVATVKYDGSCCAIFNGELYKRFDAKPGRKIPEGAIPCCDPDPITGHWPHWVKCDPDNPSDKWFFVALKNAKSIGFVHNEDHTYEAVGQHFNGNPYNMSYDLLMPHGDDVIAYFKFYPVNFESIKSFLFRHVEEGIVFWDSKGPVCKIKRKDFGFPWPVRNYGEN